MAERDKMSGTGLSLDELLALKKSSGPKRTVSTPKIVPVMRSEAPRKRRSLMDMASKSIKDKMDEPVKRKRGRPSKSEMAQKWAPVMQRQQPSVLRKATPLLNDGRKLEELPDSGKCTCGSEPYDWFNNKGQSLSKRNENIGFFCSSALHGGNGRFWLFPSNGRNIKRKKGKVLKSRDVTLDSSEV